MTELPCLVDSMSFPSSIEEAGGEGGAFRDAELENYAALEVLHV